MRSPPFVAAVLVGTLVAGTCAPGAAAALGTVTLEVMSGSAVNAPTPLVVRQTGQPDVRTTARYDTRPLGPYAPYYALRIGYWTGLPGREWGVELEHLHHRLFLANRPAEIQEFAIHTGYNYFLLGPGWRRGGWTLHLGAGPIVTSPESIVRGREYDPPGRFLDAGYRLSGVGGQAAVTRTIPLPAHLFVTLEAALVGGGAWRIPVAGGSSDVPNLGLHGHVGLGAWL